VSFDLPNDLAEFTLLLIVTAAAGTTPTLDALLQDSPDVGQTWRYTGNKFAQMVGVDQRQISISRERYASQPGTESSAANPAKGAAGAGTNGPIARRCRIWFMLGGSAGPSFTVNLFLIGNVPAAA
jgi:hypothetical protein